jgi:beta-N-acetylhexosaminidase
MRRCSLRIVFRKLSVNTHNDFSCYGITVRPAFLIVLISAVILGCVPEKKSKHENAAPPDKAREESLNGDSSVLYASAYAQAARIAAGLDRRQLAAQVILAGIDGRGSLTRDMRVLLDECPAGGIMLFRYNLDTTAEEIQNLTAEVSALITARVPLPGFDEPVSQNGQAAGVFPFVAVDHEGGQVVRFNNGIADLRSPAYYTALAHNNAQADEARRDDVMARIEADNFRAGAEIVTLGINMNFAPVAEFLNAHNDVFLGSRSYGDDPAFVTEAAAACIRGMEEAGVLCVVKHFPGSAGKDPHLFSSVINAGVQELDYIISPFASLIRGGKVRAVMVSHALVPARDPDHIASLSPTVMNDWLRDELGFAGIVICDDFSMAAAGGGGAPADHVAAVVNSLGAGADMVMVWPRDIRRTHRAIHDALANGSLSPERLEEAVRRIIYEKIRMGLLNGG